MKVDAMQSIKQPLQDNNPFVSAVMPCLNEERTLGICITKAQSAFAAMHITGEVVVVDNGSTDQSVKIAESMGARVVHASVRGYGTALHAGITAAEGSLIVIGDSDDSYDWSDIAPFVETLTKGYDLVIGNRFRGGIEPHAMPWLHRYLGNPVLSFISRHAFRVSLGDFHCGMRAFSKQAYERMQPSTPGMEYATEMIACAARNQLRITEIPIRYYPDKRGRPSHLRPFRDGWRHLRFIVTYTPDYLYFLPAIAMLALGTVLQVLLFAGPVQIGAWHFGIHFLALGGLLSLTGLNIAGMGVLAKAMMANRYPKAIGYRTDRFMRFFTLERGLLAGALLFTIGFVIDTDITLFWLKHLGQTMNETVHPAFVATHLMACGTNIVFLSFVLHLMLQEHK